MRRQPRTLISTSLRTMSSVVAAKSVGLLALQGVAAELTRMSTPPSSATARATSASTEAWSPVSVGTGTIRRPVSSERIFAAVSRSAAVRAAITTSAPSVASARAMA